MVTLQEFLEKLHPSFDDCPAPCARMVDDERPRDLPDYCAECEVRNQLDYFEQSARRELERRFEAGECAWSFAELQEDVSDAMRLAHRARRGTYPRGCSALEARLVDIVRREERRPERIRGWELQQKAVSNNG